MSVDPARLREITRIFRPSAPVQDEAFFVGRGSEQERLKRTLFAPGRHVALFGQRGVGKTSILNVVLSAIPEFNGAPVIWHTCSRSDRYESIFRTYLSRTEQLFLAKHTKTNIVRGFDAKAKVVVAEGSARSSYEEEHSIAPVLSDVLTPDAIVSTYCNRPSVLVLDEFDRIDDTATKELVAETLKILADRNAPLKVVVAGISNSVAALIGAHPSTVRNVSAIQIGPMSREEAEEVGRRGFAALGLAADESTLQVIAKASHGVPYFVHLICEELAIQTVDQGRNVVRLPDFFAVLPNALRAVGGAIEESFSGLDRHLPQASTERFSVQDRTPTAIRRLIVMAHALTTQGEYDEAADIACQLIPHEGFVPHDYQEFSGVDIEVILQEVAQVTDLITEQSGRYEFRDAFCRAYAWLQAATRYGPDALLPMIQISSRPIVRP